MTDICFIGPVSILEAHLYENNTFEFSNSAEQIVSSSSTITTRGQYSETYGFDVVCTYDEALQLKGVVEMGEMIWMNTSDLTDNDYLQHKGWVLLTNLTMELENPTQLVSCSIEYIKISDHEAEYLTMDYSKGIYDGVSLTPEYSITTTSYLLQEDGSDITTNWSTVREFPTTATTSATTDGSEFDIACASAIDGNWANAYIICDTIKFTPPFTFETVLDRNTLPGAGSFPSGFGVMFTPNDIPNGSNEIIDKRNGDYLELQWNVANTATSLQLSYLGSGGSYQSRFSGLNMGTTYAELGIRMEFTADKRVIVSTDLDTTGTWTQQYYGPTGLVNSDNLILYLYNRNKDTTSYTGSFQYENITRSNQETFPNIIMTPPDAVLNTAATGTRVTADGTASYYSNPTSELRYGIDKTKYYQGSVKLLSTNNDNTESRQVFGTGIKLTPLTTMLTNGMTRLTFDADEMIVEGYISGAWAELNRFDYGTAINLIRPIFINSERVVLQINETKVTMLRSSPIVTLEHPNTTLTYTLRDTYTRGSGTISSPGAAADIAMTADTDYWCTIYNTATPTNQLLIGKQYKSTIKSDSLPAASKTAIGWFKNGDTGIELASSKIQQWYKQTRTGISLKQVI